MSKPKNVHRFERFAAAIHDEKPRGTSDASISLACDEVPGSSVGRPVVLPIESIVDTEDFDASGFHLPKDVPVVFTGTSLHRAWETACVRRKQAPR